MFIDSAICVVAGCKSIGKSLMELTGSGISPLTHVIKLIQVADKS